MIELLNKPIDKWTELDAIVESIKLWSYLAKNGKRTKALYFKHHKTYENDILSGCFLCEYIFTNKRIKWERKTGDAINRILACRKFNCCLKNNSLCAFNKDGSAYNIWYETDTVTKEEIKLRKDKAVIILNALKARYKKLTGEMIWKGQDYYTAK